MFQTVITGSGAHIPPVVKKNTEFLSQDFYRNGTKSEYSPSELIQKFEAITGIGERRYEKEGLTASHIGAQAAEKAIKNAGINPEELDLIIVAHNFGNVEKNTSSVQTVPSLASLIKHKLSIRNPSCVAYDILFGCPGWLQGVIQADSFLKSGMAKKIIVIGTETLSRVSDPFDRDSMIFSDGAGAVVLEYKDVTSTGQGFLGSTAETYAGNEVNFINMGHSSNPNEDQADLYLKMNGRKVYEFALQHVPIAMKKCVEKCGMSIDQICKVFIHQANAKMDEAIIERFYQLYDQTVPTGILPMNIQWLGNSSVATIPTLFDMVCKGELPEHKLEAGDVILFASVGAGMNINAACYRY